MRGKLALLTPLLALIVCGGLLWVLDRVVMSGLEDLRVLQLSEQAERELSTIDGEIDTLLVRVNERADQAAALAKRQLPTLDDLKALQRDHHLRLTQMEQTQTSDKATPGQTRYVAVLTGTVGGVVRFVRDLETRHVLRTTRLTLTPANEDGSRVAVTLDLVLRTE